MLDIKEQARSCFINADEYVTEFCSDHANLIKFQLVCSGNPGPVGGSHAALDSPVRGTPPPTLLCGATKGHPHRARVAIADVGPCSWAPPACGLGPCARNTPTPIGILPHLVYHRQLYGRVSVGVTTSSAYLG